MSFVYMAIVCVCRLLEGSRSPVTISPAWLHRARMCIFMNQFSLVQCVLTSRLIATPLAASVGIREKVRLRVENPILELCYISHSRNPTQVHPNPNS